MSHIAFTYHLIFGTYRRMQTIPIEHERELYKFLYNFSVRRDVKIWRIGGMPDHVHILCDIPSKVAVAEFVKILKGESSKFLKANSHFNNWQGWSEGYGGFTIDAQSRDVRINYIKNQKSHHRIRSFVDEYRELLMSAGYPLDTPILGDDDT